MKKANETTPLRPISVIASEIANDWKKPYFGAKPYMDAMFSLNTVSDRYISDSGKSIINYFLCNAQTWRGETAKRVKAELNRMIK